MHVIIHQVEVHFPDSVNAVHQIADTLETYLDVAGCLDGQQVVETDQQRAASPAVVQ